MVVSDVTEIHFSGKKAYLSVHMDFFGKMIYGYCLSLSADVRGVTSSLKMAVKKLQSNRPIFPPRQKNVKFLKAAILLLKKLLLPN